MPKVYRTSNLQTALSPEFPEEAQTRFSVILGDNGLFNDSGIGVDCAKRNAARIALVMERGTAGCWMAPVEELSAEDVQREITELKKTDRLSDTNASRRVTLFPLGDVCVVELASEPYLYRWAFGVEIPETENEE